MGSEMFLWTTNQTLSGLPLSEADSCHQGRLVGLTAFLMLLTTDCNFVRK